MTKEIVIQMIQNAESGEIGFYMKAALERYREVFPEWEIIYTALPKKDSEERRQTIQYIIEKLQKQQIDESELEI